VRSPPDHATELARPTANQRPAKLAPVTDKDLVERPADVTQKFLQPRIFRLVANQKATVRRGQLGSPEASQLTTMTW
jgi:hypothetical protein